MKKLMSLKTRKELLASVRDSYLRASWVEKGKILDGFVAATDYDRKYAIQILNAETLPDQGKSRHSVKKYDDQVRLSLITLWNAANKICSKRLVPFLPELISVMETKGHLRLPSDVRDKLLSLSPATVDRLLRTERERVRLGISTTQKGTLLKNKIQVRTFADWDDVTPGFIEADLVAHCGGNTNGPFLNTLTLVDICTGWLECMPLLHKSAKNVIDGLKVANDLTPFQIQGLDTDCGSEFINYEVLDYCETHNITFTRARTHRKNDQAHVEEKNGSVVRRLVGYERFEGIKSWEAMAELYGVLRQYVNFFQPSMKLLEKERKDGKVSKKYDTAKTPYQRVLLSESINQANKEQLTKIYRTLDPVDLLARMEKLQDCLWQHAQMNNSSSRNQWVVTCDDIDEDSEKDVVIPESAIDNRYYRSGKNQGAQSKPRTWRTRADPFEKTWDEIRLQLELNPESTAKQLIERLIEKYPGEYSTGQTRTLQRRIAQWRLEQTSQEEKMRLLMTQAK